MTEFLITRDLRYQYSEHEHVRLAEDLAHAIVAMDSAVKLFERAKAAHKEARERMESEIRDLSRKLSDGWEIRDVHCHLLPNDPEPGKRTIVRVDTGEVIAVEYMETGRSIDAPPPDKLFETVIESVVDQVNASALNTPGVTCTASMGPVDETSTEERTRTRKSRRAQMRGQGAILPDHRKPDPPAPGVQP